jgi:AAA+ superfamily predicted ATPase/V8-like Glu-specific endopeptidase
MISDGVEEASNMADVMNWFSKLRYYLVDAESLLQEILQKYLSIEFDVYYPNGTWKEPFAQEVEKGYNSDYKNKYAGAREFIVNRGIEPYNISDMDVTIITAILIGRGPFECCREQKVRSLLPNMRDKRNKLSHLAKTTTDDTGSESKAEEIHDIIKSAIETCRLFTKTVRDLTVEKPSVNVRVAYQEFFRDKLNLLESQVGTAYKKFILSNEMDDEEEKIQPISNSQKTDVIDKTDNRASDRNSIASDSEKTHEEAEIEPYGTLSVTIDPAYKGDPKRSAGVRLAVNLINSNFDLSDSGVTISWNAINDDGSLTTILTIKGEKGNKFVCQLERSLGKVYRCIVKYRSFVGAADSPKITESDFAIKGIVAVSRKSGSDKDGFAIMTLRASVSEANFQGQQVYSWFRNDVVIAEKYEKIIQITKDDIGTTFICVVSHPGLTGELSSNPYNVSSEDFKGFIDDTQPEATPPIVTDTEVGIDTTITSSRSETKPKITNDKNNTTGGLFNNDRPAEIVAPRFRCFDSNLGRLYYFIANRNDYYATNTFQYLDYYAFLHLLLQEQGFERVIIVSHKSENRGDNFPVIAYDSVSELTFSEDFLSKYEEYRKQNDKEDKKTFIAEYCKSKEDSAGKQKPDPRAGMGGKRTTEKEQAKQTLRFGRRVIRTIIPDYLSGNEKVKKVVTFKDFSEFLVVPALKQKVIPTAVVLPLEFVQRKDYLDAMLSSNLRDQIVSASDNILIITADQESALTKLFDTQEYEKTEHSIFDAVARLEKSDIPISRSDAIVRELSEKRRILIAAKIPGIDEIANLLITKKLEQPELYARLTYSKVYSIADFILSKCSNTENTQKAFPDIDNNTWYVGNLENLEKALRDPAVLNVLLNLAEKELWNRQICRCSNLKATYVERIYAGPIRWNTQKEPPMPLMRAQISEAERAHENEEAMRELNELIGLSSVKELLKKRFSAAKYDKSNGPGHYIFAGNPGTGKTVVARLMGEILHSQGLLAKGHVVEVQKADLVSNHVGESPLKTRAKCEEALDGVLFLDEAYQLVNTEENTSEIFQSDFDKEAYTELMAFMENNKKRLCVICAGYPFQMDLFRKANPGMARRIPEKNWIEFPDYSPEELYDILQKMAKDAKLTLTEEFNSQARIALQQMWEEKDKEFGNAGDVQSFLDECKDNASVRSAEMNLPSLELMAKDIPAKFIGENLSSAERKQKQAEAMESLNEMIGLENVKKQIKKISSLRALSKRANKGPGNYIFAGHPGTGKTVVARKLGEILKAYGILKKGHTIEVSQEDLVAEYLGQSAIKTKKQCRKALDGVLFVDEAYELVNTEPNDSRKFTSDFTKEAYTTIMKFMEDNASRICVVFAGYSKEMEIFKKANSGMGRRITRTINFEDYSDDELIQILELTAKKENDPPVELSKEFIDETRLIIPRMRSSAADDFGNAGDIIKYLKECIGNAAVRIADEGLIDEIDRVILEKRDVPEEYLDVEDIDNTDDTDKGSHTESNCPQFQRIPKSELTCLFDPYDGIDIHGSDFPGYCRGAVLRIENEFGTSTAFVISPDGLAITCAHAVAYKKDLRRIASKKLFADFKTIGEKETRYPYEIINVKPDLDMAIIRIFADKALPYLKLAAEDRQIKFGEECVLYGYPEGRKGIMQFPGTVSTEAELGGDGELGIIYFFSGDAYPGDSGGPIIAKSDGCVIGILRGARGPQDGTKHNYMKPTYYFWKQFLK